MPLPWPLRRRLLSSLLGFQIAPSARIGWSIILSRVLIMGEGARIGSLTLVKGLSELKLGDYAYLGNLNWVTGLPEGDPVFFTKDTTRRPALIIGDHAAVTHRHLIDCTDTVELGEFTTFAGWGSQILTHAIDISENRQSSAPVSIGPYCFVGTRCIFLKGSALPGYSILAAGSVMSTKENELYVLYAGNKAKKVKSLDQNNKYFQRCVGFIE